MGSTRGWAGLRSPMTPTTAEEPGDTLAVVSEPEAIVRDLARLSPIVDSDLGDYCGMCGKVAGAAT